MIEDKSQTQPILRSWVENIKSTFNSKKDSTLQIYFGSNKIYDQVGDKTPQVDRLGDSLGRKFQQALESSSSLKNGVRIVSDGMKVYHALRGTKLDTQYSLNSVVKPNLEQVQNTSKEFVSQDQTEQKPVTSLDYTPSISEQSSQVLDNTAKTEETLNPVAKSNLDQVQDTSKETISQNSVKSESTTPWNDIKSLIAEHKQNPDRFENAIFQLLVDQTTRINQLEQKVEAMSQKKPLNSKVDRWLGRLQQSSKEALQELRGLAQQVPQNVVQFLGDTKNKIQDNLERRLADVAGNTLNAGTRYLAERFGRDNGEGVKVFKGNSLIIAASAQHSGIYSKDGQKLVQNGQIVSPVTSDQLNKIAQVPVEARSLKQSEKQVATATKALRV
ncbi:hypothetical protein [aff. Roholtiella sp. LEGE 12411]|uniref:hypothetical protein n=1 Tax=aff. Roholtiella sp. LEGE 12411 TaxID=1828822 RepID=UPI0018819AAD|nr:hypothetical protein [aff. Roholtiella sp. LEGE 12411]MBE9035193.1 hypothetical protein [aff. Roholtiella sp. LEGE 12411]